VRVGFSVFNYDIDLDELSTNNTFTGPSSGPYNIDYVVADGKAIWSPCNGSAELIVNSEVRAIRNSNSSGSGAMFESGMIDLWLQWRAC
jgi:hypothetical protein